MKELETRNLETSAGLEVREDDDGSHHLVGIVVPWKATYEFKKGVTEEFSPGVFDKSIAERTGKIPLLEQHSTHLHPIGQAVSFEKTPDGLLADFRLSSSQRGEEARTLALEGIVTGFSVGFRPIRDRAEQRNGKRHIVRVESRLDHIGLVTSPAFEQARVLSIRSFDPDDAESVPALAAWRARLDYLR
jgi:HK97 family phage prohead protease